MKKSYLLSFVVLILSVFTGVSCSKSTKNVTDTVATISVEFQSIEQTGGTSGTTDSTGLILTFSVNPTTLTAEEIIVTGATKGTLSGSGTTRTLAISNIRVDDSQTIIVEITNPAGYIINNSTKTVTIYRKNYSLRDIGPAGGLVFYDKGSYSDGWRYLEAAPKSTEWVEKPWGQLGVTVPGADGTAIGTGRQNTIDIVTQYNTTPTSYAAKLCYELNYNGYNDWFLPSKDELYQICWILHSRRHNGATTENNPAYGTNRVGDFADAYYWSSSEGSTSGAWDQFFLNGMQYNNDNDFWITVRAIRAF